MAVVLVHGNPETPIIWEPLIEALGGSPAEYHTPELPGFGTAAPDGFGATKDEYVAWLTLVVEEIAADTGPVDIVGHDWGGLLTMGVVAIRPDLIRSWASDVLGLFHEDYVWHDFAQIWQTPGAGEEFFAQSAATPIEERIAAYEGLGIPRDIGARLLEASDERMSACVLALYRSAAQPALQEWGTRLGPAATRPGLAIVAAHDPFVRPDLAPVVAERLGARVHHIDTQGHWWMLGDPAAGAAMLRDHWEGS